MAHWSAHRWPQGALQQRQAGLHARAQCCSQSWTHEPGRSSSTVLNLGDMVPVASGDSCSP